MFAYKTAVAFREIGFKNIKIYNGGLKDWKKAGFNIVSKEPLPDIIVQFIDAPDLLALISAEQENCPDHDDGRPKVTLLDFRNEMILNPEMPPLKIKSICPTRYLLLDDLLRKETIDHLPKDGQFITITETGNRDAFIIKYLSKFGFNRIKALKFGMRDWIKRGYPVE